MVGGGVAVLLAGLGVGVGCGVLGGWWAELGWEAGSAYDGRGGVGFCGVRVPEAIGVMLKGI